ncbi:hypothetical protein C0J50_9538 [Silurus asotus]|uniref:C-type lectin domain-containing protein n=1 Tax=Silurus asotus TaxID=30991 RepID=A0AAD5F9S3_SILAS|nr:hypothetical protein C0J50_9538 [Silurus asotus]
MKVWIVCVLLCATFTLRTVTAAAIETGPEKEQLRIKRKFPKSILLKAWIGAYNFQGTWLWVDTARFYYSNWYSLSSVGSYPCALMNRNVGWSNTVCGSLYPYICSIDLNKC